MSHMKKTVPSKFIADEFDKILTDSKFINDSPKKKKPADTATVENPNLSITNPTNAKKKKINEGIEACGESRQKALKLINRQLEARYEDTDAEQRGEINKLGRELEEDISKLKEKLILETKRSEWENLQKYFMKSMQSKF